MPNEKYALSPREKVLVDFCQQAYADWKEGTVFVTPSVAFQMKAVTERCRKNYYGIFEQRIDEVTGEEKYWPPLTEHLVETVVKETDIDTRNMMPYSPNPANTGIAKVAKLLLLDKLKRMKMDAKLNDILRFCAIDGSKFMRVVKRWDRERERWVRDMALPDTLNVIADPAADCIEESAYIERVIMSPSDFLSMGKANPAWTNLDQAVSTKDLARADAFGDVQSNNKTPSKMFEVFEVYAELPIFVLTGDEKDLHSEKTFQAHCVLTGLGKKGSRGKSAVVVHLIEEEEYSCKPVKEARFRKVPNRRQGRGVAESLFGAQLYLNVLTGIRQMNGYILQNGLFKVKNGSGLTQEVVADLAAGGFIPVESMDDLEQLNVQDYRAASYTDEDRLFAWAQRQTFANEQVRGERTPTSQAATSSIIQDRSSKNAFSLIQEDLARPIAEFFEEFIIPHLAEEYDEEDIIRITGSAMDFAEIDRAWIEHEINAQVLGWVKENMSIPKLSDYQDALRRAQADLRKLGKSRHLKIYKSIFGGANLQMEMPITNERIDTSVIVQNLKELLAVNQASPDPKYDSDKIMARTLELMGLDVSNFERTFDPLPLPSGRMLGGTGMPVSPNVARAAAGAAAPNVGKPQGFSAVPAETAVASNAQSPIKALANAGL